MSGSHGYDTVTASARAKVGGARAGGGWARVGPRVRARSSHRTSTHLLPWPARRPHPQSATLGPVAANAVAPHAAGGATLAGGAGRSTSAGIDEAALLTAPSRKQSAAGRGQPQQPVRELSAGAAESAGEAEAAAQGEWSSTRNNRLLLIMMIMHELELEQR